MLSSHSQDPGEAVSCICKAMSARPTSGRRVLSKSYARLSPGAYQQPPNCIEGHVTTATTGRKRCLSSIFHLAELKGKTDSDARHGTTRGHEDTRTRAGYEVGNDNCGNSTVSFSCRQLSCGRAIVGSTTSVAALADGDSRFYTFQERIVEPVQLRIRILNVS